MYSCMSNHLLPDIADLSKICVRCEAGGPAAPLVGVCHIDNVKDIESLITKQEHKFLVPHLG